MCTAFSRLNMQAYHCFWSDCFCECYSVVFYPFVHLSPIVCIWCTYYVHVSRRDGCDASSPVMFAHQSKWQQSMLTLYGTDTCLIDATYKTTVYDLPLFALCVMTNVGFVTVASLLLVDERQESIAAGLRQVLQWNPTWKPRYFMSDFHEGQIAAVTSVFPGL